MTVIKDVSANSDAGTASKWGGNNIMTVDNYWDDIDVSASIVNGTGVMRVNTLTRYRSGKLSLRDSGNDHNYILLTSNLGANRNLTFPLLTADDTIAVLGLAQTFTEAITIFKNQTDLFYLKKNSNTVGTAWELNFEALDSASNATPYATIRAEIDSNTDTTEQGSLYLRALQSGGIETDLVRCNGTDQTVQLANNLRVKISSSGLSATRTYTFPDATGKVVTEDATATLTKKTISSGFDYGHASTDNVIKGTGVDNPYAGQPTGATLKRTGLYCAITDTSAEGIVGNTWTAIGTGANFRSTTEGFGRALATGAVANNNAGLRQGTARWRREWTCYAIGRFSLSSTSDIRVFIGWSSDTAEIAGETTLNNFSGCGIGKRTGDTNWFTMRNDGDATEDRVDTTIAASTSFFTFEMQLDATNFQCKINGTSQTAQTTELPASATDLSFHIEIETGAGAADKTINILPFFFRQGT